MKSPSPKEVYLVITLTAACLIPFVPKAFHIDDPLFLWTAKNILISPLDYYDFAVNWYGQNMPMSLVNQNPPLIAYYIAAISLIGGMGEIALHSAFILPNILFSLGTYMLARLLTPRPFLAATLAVCSPAFMVSSTNIMCDTLMVALYVWSIYCWIHGWTINKQHFLIFSAALIFLATLTKYFAITSIPLLLAYSIFKQKSYDNRMLFLLLPVICLVFFQYFSNQKYGVGLFSYAATYAIKEGPSFHFRELMFKTLSGFAFVGGSVLSIIFFVPFLWRRATWPRLVIIPVVLSLLVLVNPTLTPDSKGLPGNFLFILQFSLLGSGGMLLIILAGAHLWHNKDGETVLLFLWIIGTFAFTCYLNHMVTVRNLLPMIPAATILLTRRLKTIPTLVGSTRQLKLIAPLLATLTITLSVTIADYRLADSQRRAAIYFEKAYRHYPRSIYFLGHWGFQYYMEQFGAQALDFNNYQFDEGDIIIIPANNCNTNWSRRDIMQPVVKKIFYLGGIVSTMSGKMGAGFYSDRIGSLPFVFGVSPDEEYYVYRIKSSTL